MKRYAFVLTLLASLFAEADAKMRPVPSKEAQAAAATFAHAIVKFGGVSYWDFDGMERDRLKGFLSRQLLAAIDNVHDCVRDWARHQPANSTDKPPGVDGCVFSSSADWLPTGFAIQQTSLLPDGRRRVVIEYRYDSHGEHARWHVAVYVSREKDHYVVDDFEGGLDEAPTEHWLIRDPYGGCRDGKWVSGHD
jgi:hypothetical protein